MVKTILNCIRLEVETTNKNRRRNFIHIELSLFIFRIVYYKMRKKLTIRFEISRGWDK